MIKAVVIDGNAISRNLLSTLLSSGGYAVVGDANASTAGLAAMVKLRPQIVCIDVGAADEEGWERLETLSNSLPKALVFMVSGQFQPATLEQALQRGVQGFIAKPFKEATVLATIRKAIMKVAREHQARTSGA